MDFPDIPYTPTRLLKRLPELIWAYVHTFPEALSQRETPWTAYRLWHVEQGSIRQRHKRLPAPTTVLVSPACGDLRVAAGTRLLSVAVTAAPGFFAPVAARDLQRVDDARLHRISRRLVRWLQAHQLPDSERIAPRLPVTSPTATTTLAILQAQWLRALAHALGPQPDPPPSPPPEWRVQLLLAAMEAALPGPMPPTDDLARPTGISWRRLEQLFAEETGVPPTRYYEQQRLTRVQQALVTTRWPLKRVAYDCGFRDPAHFTQWFRRLTGMPPSHWRTVQGEAL